MKTIKNSKDITTLEVDDKVVFGNLEHTVVLGRYGYYLASSDFCNTRIFETLSVDKHRFIKSLGIHANYTGAFPETISLEALTAIVSALFKEYEKQKELPKTWEEFCEKNRAKAEYYISNGSCIIGVEGSRNPNTDKNLCISKQEAEAFLALMQLRQLRKVYVKDWEPDWTKANQKYNILLQNDRLRIYPSTILHRVLSFPTYNLAEQFLTNFKGLLEIAKPLL